MVERIEQSGMRPVIDSKFSFTQLGKALEYLVSGRHFGKVVVEL